MVRAYQLELGRTWNTRVFNSHLELGVFLCFLVLEFFFFQNILFLIPTVIPLLQAYPLFCSLLAHWLPNSGVSLISYFLNFSRTAGSILGAGFNAFISDWDKISATVSYKIPLNIMPSRLKLQNLFSLFTRNAYIFFYWIISFFPVPFLQDASTTALTLTL